MIKMTYLNLKDDHHQIHQFAVFVGEINPTLKINPLGLNVLRR